MLIDRGSRPLGERGWRRPIPPFPDISERRRKTLLSVWIGVVIVAIAAAAFVSGRLNEADMCGRVGSPEGVKAQPGRNGSLVREALRAQTTAQQKGLHEAADAADRIASLAQERAPRAEIIDALAHWWTFCDTQAERNSLRAEPDWRLFGRPLVD